MTPSWILDDAERRNRERPDTFFIPPLEHRENLAVGDLVKLVFLIEEPGGGRSGERMWVEVTGVLARGSYRGTLLNVPAAETDLAAGDEILFEARHVAAKEYGVDELGYDAGEAAAVNRRIRAGRPPGRVIHTEEPPGWWVFAGDEDERERADGSNFEWWTLGDLTDRFPELAEPFSQADRGGYWDRAPEGGFRWFPL